MLFSAYNQKALYTIFSVVTPSEFRYISNCEISKEVWGILKITHDGTQTVKDSKPQALTSNSEKYRMQESKTFYQFYARLSDVVNDTFSFGEAVSEAKIVRNVLKYVQECFRAKITAIEESKNLNTM